MCLSALALWRRSVQDGVAQPGQSPLLEPQNPAPVPISPPEPPIITPMPGNWQTLTQLQPVKGDKPPLEIRFPDGSTAPVKYWSDIPHTTVSWLNRQGILDETGIPIQSGKRYILSHNDVHPTEKKFTNSRKINQFYLETNYSNVNNINNTKAVIESVGKGVEPGQFSVRLP